MAPNYLLRVFRRLPLITAALLSLIACLVPGCSQSGPELAPVTGRVTLDGQPFALAHIEFQPESTNGSASFGITDRDGHYELGYTRDKRGALLGWHTVRITSETERDGPQGEAVYLRQRVPARYNEESELREKVAPDKQNVFNFELFTSGE